MQYIEIFVPCCPYTWSPWSGERSIPLKKIAMLGLAVAALAVSATALSSGLKPGEQVPAFDVVDVNGPNKGKQLCYRCSYGNAPVAAAFIKSGSSEAATLVAGLQKLVNEHKAHGLRSFVVFMGGAELKPSIEKLAAEKKISVPLTFLPQGPSAEDVRQYQISPDANNTVLLWSKGQVRSNFVNVTGESWGKVAAAASAMLQ